VAADDRVAELHQTAILVDGHNDLPWRLRDEFDSDLDRFDIGSRHTDGHTDIPRLRDGGVDAQFFAAYVPGAYAERGIAVEATLEQIDLIHRLTRRYPDFELARTAEDIRRTAGSGKIAVLIAVEGGHSIGSSLGVLRMYHELGARYMTLTHADNNEWADAATQEPEHGGLTAFGEDVVREMNRLGMLVDVSHVSAETMEDVLRVSRAPVIASHSNARAVNDHPRNVPDPIIRRMADDGGVVMVNFSSGFIVPEAADVVRDMFAAWRAAMTEHPDDRAAQKAAQRSWEQEHPVPRGTVSHVVDHIDHIVRLTGPDHVGLGSDFDGVSVVPEGLEDASRYPAITAELVRRGYADEDVVKVLGGNVLRAMEAVETVARQLQAAGSRA